MPVTTQAQASAARSRNLRDLALACCAYQLIFSAGVLLWLPRDLGLLGVCSLPPLAVLALALGSRADAQQYALRLVVATLMLPILLLFWAGSVDSDVPAAPAGLDEQALFRGAEAVQDTERSGALLTLRNGRFADGSELRLSRFADAEAARGYLAMLAQSMQTEPFAEAGRRGLRMLAGGVDTATWIVVEQHGRDLLELRAADRGAVLARLAAQGVPAPRDDAPAARPAAWPFFTAMALGHGAAVTALVAWFMRRRAAAQVR